MRTPGCPERAAREIFYHPSGVASSIKEWPSKVCLLVLPVPPPSELPIWLRAVTLNLRQKVRLPYVQFSVLEQTKAPRGRAVAQILSDNLPSRPSLCTRCPGQRRQGGRERTRARLWCCMGQRWLSTRPDQSQRARGSLTLPFLQEGWGTRAHPQKQRGGERHW